MNVKKDFGNYVDNLIVLRFYTKCRTAAEFAKLLEIDAKRYVEVENKRVHPDKILIAAIEKYYGYTFDQMKHYKFDLSIELI